MNTKIKLCGIRFPEDVEVVNRLKPEYIGFVFWPSSHRCISPETAAGLKALLDPSIKAVGVFVDAPVETVADLLNDHVIDIAQLHGHESDDYITTLRSMASGLIIRAYKIRTPEDIRSAEKSTADMILLDSGTGSGEKFDWSLVSNVNRPFFLAGGLTPDNVSAAIGQIRPYGVDVSSGIETDKRKDPIKMQAFTEQVRDIQKRS